MTNIANRNNVKPILGVITMMVVILCLFAAGASQGIGPRQRTDSDGVPDGCFCPTSLGMPDIIAFITIPTRNFAFFALGISFIYGFAYFALIIMLVSGLAFLALIILLLCGLAFGRRPIFPENNYLARFAVNLIAIFAIGAFIKFRERFDCFAFVASFGYALLRHNQLLVSWLCLEPSTGPIPVSGSLYCIGNEVDVK